MKKIIAATALLVASQAALAQAPGTYQFPSVPCSEFKIIAGNAAKWRDQRHTVDEAERMAVKLYKDGERKKASETLIGVAYRNSSIPRDVFEALAYETCKNNGGN